MNRCFASLSVTAAAVLVLAGCASPAQPLEITRADYSQYQSTPNFDGGPWSETDPQRLAELASVLQENGWSPGWVAKENICAGGKTTTFDLLFSDNSHESIDVHSCGNEAEPLRVELERLVEEWK